jgi:flagellar basal-body rod protein FlgB
MSMSFLNSPLNKAIEAGLDVGALNHRLISDNIANVDTPGYKGLRLNFEAFYEDAKKAFEDESKAFNDGSKVSSPMSMLDPNGYIFRDDTTTMRLDGNNVDPEREMVELAQNTLNYAALVELLNRRSAYMMMVITGGRG